MKEFILTLFKGSEERFKNPFFRAFITSWILFNWKPILYIVFEKVTAEEKINKISSDYSDACHVILYPLASSLFYYLAFPYITVWFDKRRKKALSDKKIIITDRKKDDINHQIEIAVKEIEFEEEKTKFRERHTHNNIVEDLQKKIKSYEEQIDSITQRNENQLQRFENELIESKKTNKRIKEDFDNIKNKLIEKEKTVLALEKEINDLKFDLQESILSTNNNISRQSSLSNQDLEILNLIKKKNSISEIAQKLNLNRITIQERINRIKDKFNLKTDEDLHLFAQNNYP